MYYIEDKPAAIKEVQSFLRNIGYDSLPVIISGKFDDNTIVAVKDFKEKNGIDTTGYVNSETYRLLNKEQSIKTQEKNIREKYDSFIIFPLRVGMSGNEIEYINDMISEFLDYYGHFHNVRRGGFFTSATEEGVIIIQEIFGIDKTGIIDEFTYERMLIERDSIYNLKSS